MTDLLDRLRKVDGSDEGTHWYRNPDGPEAAAEIERLRAELDGCKAAFDDRVRVIKLQLEDKRKLQANLAEAEALLRESLEVDGGPFPAASPDSINGKICAFLARRKAD